MRKKPETLEEVMRRWPRLTAHLIAESLGYATPSKAASIILDTTHRRENWCEWIYSCYNKDPLKAVQDAIRNRHHHSGYMAEYKLAYALVRRAIDTGEEPIFASWF
jgi:hypothetical protein